MKKIFLPVIIFILAISAGCGNSYKHLSADEASKIIQTQNDIIILDVRTVEEYEKNHIPNALNWSIDELRKGNFEPLKDKNRKILVYCWTGRRAEEAAKILSENGYRNVFEFGGLVDWTGELETSAVDAQ